MARCLDGFDDLRAAYGEQLRGAVLDLTDTSAMRREVDRVFAVLGRVDVVSSNAGYGLFGAAEEVTVAQIDRQIAGSFSISGDPGRYADAIVATADAERPARRLVLGTMAYANTERSLVDRLHSIRTQKAAALGAGASEAVSTT